MAGNEFLLPNELGWDCNDEIKARINSWLAACSVRQSDIMSDIRVSQETRYETLKTFNEVANAELADDIYAIIKKYQEKK